MTTYADSSFLVSHYLQDAHSPEVDRRMVHRPRIWLTPLHKAEVAHAVFLHVFHRLISRNDAGLAWGGFEQDYAGRFWIRIDLPDGTWETSVHLARQYGPALGVRTLDSLHVACALELRAQKFWTFDDRQNRLAQAAGLDTTP